MGCVFRPTALSQEHGPNIQLGPLYPTSLHIEAGQPGKIGTAPLLDAGAKFINGEPEIQLILRCRTKGGVRNSWFHCRLFLGPRAKNGKNGGKMGEIRPKRCAGVGITSACSSVMS